MPGYKTALIKRDPKVKMALFVGVSGFPVGLAAIQRQKLLAKALVREGWKVIVVNTRSTHRHNVTVARVGHLEGIMYIYLFNPYRPSNFIKRNFQKFLSPILEFGLLFNLRQRFRISVALVSHRNSIVGGLKYRIFSVILKFKVVINLVEIYKGRKGVTILQRANDAIFNRAGLFCYDAYLPISHKIVDYFKRITKPHYLVPVIVDASRITETPREPHTQPYFLFCGAAAYQRSFAFILNAFGSIGKNARLIFVANGSDAEIERIEDMIKAQHLEDSVKVFQNLPDGELHKLYVNAVGLLLPLFATLQDEARFPHKLGEYLASGNVVLSNPVGELLYYLKNFENIILSDVDDAMKYAASMKWVLENRQEASRIGQKGQSVGVQAFDYKSLSRGVSEFLNKI